MSDSPAGGEGLKFAPNKWWYIGGGVAAYLVYRHYKNAQAAVASTASTTTDTSSTDPNAYDPSAAYSGAYGTTPSAYGYTDPSTGAFITGPYLSTATGVVPTTNAEWFQQATAWLIQQGYDPITVAGAFGLWVANGNLSDSQLSIAQAAIAEFGQPPQGIAAPHGAPPSGQTPQPTGNDTSAPVLKVSGTLISWNAKRGAVSYHIHQVDTNRPVEDVVGTAVTVAKGHTYNVSANFPGGAKGAVSNTVRV